MATADESAADAASFQRFLHARQFPADCRETTGVLTWAGARPGAGGRQGAPYPGNYFYLLGLGSQLVSLKFNLLSALLTPGAVYHFPTSHYINPVRCPGRTFGCYFAPVTNCTISPLPDPGSGRRLQAMAAQLRKGGAGGGNKGRGARAGRAKPAPGTPCLPTHPGVARYLEHNIYRSASLRSRDSCSLAELAELACNCESDPNRSVTVLLGLDSKP